MKIMLIGPGGKTGGASIHTRMVKKYLIQKGHIVKFINIYNNKGQTTSFSINNIFDIIYKIIKRVFIIPIYILVNHKNYDIIHVQSSGPIGGFLHAITASILRSFIKFNLIITFHYSKTSLFVKKYPNLMKFVIKNCSLFIVVSKKQKNIIEKYSLEKFSSKVIIINNGFEEVEIEKIKNVDIFSKYKISKNSKILINVAWLLEKKGQIYLIKSIEILIKKYKNKNFHCFIIGQGPLYTYLDDYIKKNQLEKFITLTNYISNNELYSFFNKANIFVLSSLEEGNPLVMFESLGFGIPFISTNVGGIPEIITSEELGLLCDPKDIDHLAKNIDLALNKNWNYQYIQKYGLQYTWSKITDNTIKAYEKIIYESG